MLVDPTNARAEGSAAVARAASAKWRKHDTARRAFLGPQQAALDEILLDKIQIRSSARVQTVARQGVEFPITIRNNLQADAANPEVRAVKVNLVFRLRTDSGSPSKRSRLRRSGPRTASPATPPSPQRPTASYRWSRS